VRSRFKIARRAAAETAGIYIYSPMMIGVYGTFFYLVTLATGIVIFHPPYLARLPIWPSLSLSLFLSLCLSLSLSLYLSLSLSLFPSLAARIWPGGT
jgi:hypothetical protein